MRTVPLPVECRDSDCPLYHRCDCVQGEVLTDSDTDRVQVMFIGEAPGKSEVGKGRPFVGVSGRLLRRALDFAAPTRINYAFSNAIRCLPLDQAEEIRKPTAAESRHCAPHLRRDIRQTDPDVLVLLGATAIDLFLSDRPTVHEERGRWRRVEIEGRERIVLTTWHPAFVGRQKSALPLFYTDLQFALRLAAGWRPRPEWGALGTSRCIGTVDGVIDLVERIRSLPSDAMVALDVETRNLNKRYGNRLGMVQFCWDGGAAYCVPLDHPRTPFDPDELRVVRKVLRRLFTRPVGFRAWITHFGKFEQTQIGQHILDRGDGVVRTFSNAPMLDTGAFAYLLNENATAARGSYNLKRLARHYLGFEHYDDATLMARAEGNLLDLPLTSPAPVGQPGWVPNLTDYGGMDVQTTWRLFHALREEAVIQGYRKKALRLLEHLFGPTFRLLSQIERNGFWGNLSHLKMLQDPERSPIVSRLNEIDKQKVPSIKTAQRANERLVAQVSGGNTPLFDMPWVMDLNKNDHVRAWLIDEMNLEPLSRGKSGAPSVGKAFFQAYGDVEEVALVEERRGLAKLKSAYVKQLIEYIDPRYAKDDSRDGRVRCDLSFTTTVSGRGSASNPNMQQQVRGDSPAKAAIKNIWQAEQPGVQQSFAIDFNRGPPDLSARVSRTAERCLVQLDFMANEVRLLAILSQCPELAKALNHGKAARDRYRQNPSDQELKKAAEIGGDLHKQTAALMFGLTTDQIDKPKRQAAKGIVFGAMYGRGVNALAAQIKRTRDEAQALMDKFSGAFPVGWSWLQRCPVIASDRWFIESPLGRRRRLPGYLVHADGMSHDDQRLVAECDRMAKNSPIQGTASDAAFLGSCLFSQYIESNDRAWYLQNVVHDSCVYEVPIAELRESIAVAERCFTTETMALMTEVWGVNFNCPIEVEFEIGLRWGALTKWDFTEPALDRIVDLLRHEVVAA